MRPFRSELKFLTHIGVREMLLARWDRYLVRAPYMNRYGASSILSQYYDSPDLLFYREKLDGVARRPKVRIRTFGLQFKPGSTTFLEIKLRTNDRVRKRRYRFAEFDPSYLDFGIKERLECILGVTYRDQEGAQERIEATITPVCHEFRLINRVLNLDEGQRTNVYLLRPGPSSEQEVESRLREVGDVVTLSLYKSDQHAPL